MTPDEMVAELTAAERLAVELVEDVYACAAGSAVLDGVTRWDRLAMRVASSAWASDIPRAIESLARKLEAPHLHGAAITRALASPPDTRRAVLAAMRDESAAIVALVRARRDARRKTREERDA